MTDEITRRIAENIYVWTRTALYGENRDRDIQMIAEKVATAAKMARREAEAALQAADALEREIYEHRERYSAEVRRLARAYRLAHGADTKGGER